MHLLIALLDKKSRFPSIILPRLGTAGCSETEVLVFSEQDLEKKSSKTCSEMKVFMFSEHLAVFMSDKKIAKTLKIKCKHF